MQKYEINTQWPNKYRYFVNYKKKTIFAKNNI